MEKEDARKQSREVLHERRKQVIRMRRKGMPVMQIVEYSGLGGSAVNAAITRYPTAAAPALKPAARGKKQGSGRLLSESQESAVRKIICDKRPEHLKMGFALWNRATVMRWVERECGIKLPVRGVGNYLIQLPHQ
jgi:transposase